jgi:hypothetical protein
VPSAMVVALSGCISHRAEYRQPKTIVEVRQPKTAVYPAGELVVVEQPPSPRQEVVSTAPDDRHVWVAGHWVRASNNWVWVPGHWEARPRPTAVWITGHWDKRSDGSWVWTPGYWN